MKDEAPQLKKVARAYAHHVNRSLARLATLMGSQIESRSDGAYVFDEHGQPYLDCGGFGVFLLGHRHPTIVDAVKRQLDVQPLTSRLLLSPAVAAAAEAIAGVAPEGLEYVYLTTSGAEAVELGLKLGRLHGKRQVVSTVGGFHGKTCGALSICGRDKHFRDVFEPLLPNINQVPYGDIRAMERTLQRIGPEAIVFIEPIQGEGGVIVPPPGYLTAVAECVRNAGALLVVDEIQTGLGRTGSWWAIDSEGFVPDLLLAGKVLGGGVVPAGALIARPETFAPLNDDAYLHSSTFGNNPLAGAAAIATIETLRLERVPQRADRLGMLIRDGLARELAPSQDGLVKSVRGRGLLIGIEFDTPSRAGEFVLELFRRRVLASFALAGHSVVRLTPPVCMSEGDVDRLLSAATESKETIAAQQKEMTLA